MERNEYRDVFQGSSLGNQMNGSIILTQKEEAPAFWLARLGKC